LLPSPPNLRHGNAPNSAVNAALVEANGRNLCEPFFHPSINAENEI